MEDAGQVCQRGGAGTRMSQEFHMSDPKDAIAVTSGCGCLLLSTLCWLAIGLLVVMALIKFVFG